MTSSLTEAPSLPSSETTGHSIGKPVDRVDGRDKTTGTAQYSAEYPYPNLAYAPLVHSTVARGRITGMDAASAAEVPGVLTHLSALVLKPTPKWSQLNQITWAPGTTVNYLNTDEVHWNGQPAAVDFSAEQHNAVPDTGNPIVPGKAKKGDAETALAAAPVTVDLSFSTPGHAHNALEPHSTTAAAWDSDRLTVHEGSQNIDWVRRHLAQKFAVAKDAVRVVSSYVGGGFGGKWQIWPGTLLTVMAARVTGRAVRMTLSRENVCRTVGGRTPSVQRVALGARTDGTLTALVHTGITQVRRLGGWFEPVTSVSRHAYAAENILVEQIKAALDTLPNSTMCAPGEAIGSIALATVVGTSGSAPRPPGAAMAVAADGTVLGSVSGGCVEGAVHDLALKVLATRTPVRESFGYSDSDTDAFAVGLSCGGTIDILVRPVTTAPAVHILADTLDALTTGRPIALATVTDGPDGFLGATLAVHPDQARGTLGYHVTVCDARPVFTTTQRFPDAHEGIVDWPHRLLDQLTDADELDSRTVVAVLTHEAKFDIPVLERALRLPLGYVGAMGSRRTHPQRLTAFAETGLTPEHLARLHSPIGLDLGAVTPRRDRRLHRRRHHRHPQQRQWPASHPLHRADPPSDRRAAPTARLTALDINEGISHAHHPHARIRPRPATDRPPRPAPRLLPAARGRTDQPRHHLERPARRLAGDPLRGRPRRARPPRLQQRHVTPRLSEFSAGCAALAAWILRQRRRARSHHHAAHAHP